MSKCCDCCDEVKRLRAVGAQTAGQFIDADRRARMAETRLREVEKALLRPDGSAEGVRRSVRRALAVVQPKEEKS